MSRLAAWIGWSRSALIAMAIACATAAAAQPGRASTPPEAPRTEEARFDPAAIEARLTGIKLALDRIAGSLQRDGLPVQSLFDLAQSIGPLREQLDAAIAELDPRLGQLAIALRAATARAVPEHAVAFPGLDAARALAEE